jgi:hypothetical protein
MNVNHLYFLFYFFEIPEIFPYKTPDLEYVNFATPCIKFLFRNILLMVCEGYRTLKKY